MPAPHRHPADTTAPPAAAAHRRHVLPPLAVLALVVTSLALLAFAPTAPGTVQSRRVELVDSSGRAQATLSADTSGVILSLLDKQGHVRASLRLNDDPRLSVVDGAGREAAGLGVPRVQHLAQ